MGVDLPIQSQKLISPKFDPDKEIKYDIYIELAVLGYCREYKDLSPSYLGRWEDLFPKI